VKGTRHRSIDRSIDRSATRIVAEREVANEVEGRPVRERTPEEEEEEKEGAMMRMTED